MRVYIGWLHSIFFTSKFDKPPFQLVHRIICCTNPCFCHKNPSGFENFISGDVFKIEITLSLHMFLPSTIQQTETSDFPTYLCHIFFPHIFPHVFPRKRPDVFQVAGHQIFNGLFDPLPQLLLTQLGCLFKSLAISQGLVVNIEWFTTINQY